MYILIENDEMRGFVKEKEEEGKQYIEIYEKEFDELMKKQVNGESLFYDKQNKKIDSIKLNQFEELVDGIAVYKKDKEVDFNNNQLTYLRKKYTELKVAKSDSKELGMDTAGFDTEIANLKLKVVSTQARVKKLM